MLEAAIPQAYEAGRPIEVIPGDPNEVDGIRNTGISENRGTNLEISELKQEVCRLAERARNLLGRPDFDFEKDEISPEALAAIARAEAQSDWKMPERFDMPRCQTTSAGRETQSVRNIYEVLQRKEQELAVLQAEIDALRKVVPLLSDNQDRTWNANRVVSRSRQPVCIP
jgi:cell division protein FtsB